jgi:hypothetical protein
MSQSYTKASPRVDAVRRTLTIDLDAPDLRRRVRRPRWQAGAGRSLKETAVQGASAVIRSTDFALDAVCALRRTGWGTAALLCMSAGRHNASEACESQAHCRSTALRRSPLEATPRVPLEIYGPLTLQLSSANRSRPRSVGPLLARARCSRQRARPFDQLLWRASSKFTQVDHLRGNASPSWNQSLRSDLLHGLGSRGARGPIHEPDSHKNFCDCACL